MEKKKEFWKQVESSLSQEMPTNFDQNFFSKLEEIKNAEAVNNRGPISKDVNKDLNNKEEGPLQKFLQTLIPVGWAFALGLLISLQTGLNDYQEGIIVLKKLQNQEIGQIAGSSGLSEQDWDFLISSAPK